MTDVATVVDTSQGVRKIYAYTTPQESQEPWLDGKGVGRIKIGQTIRENVGDRIKRQFGASQIDRKWTLLGEWAADAEDGTWISDHMVHRYLERQGHYRHEGTEWFDVNHQDVSAAILALKKDPSARPAGKDSYGLREEQDAAIKAAEEFYARSPENRWFLWNAKMRFGKTFAACMLAKRAGAKRILILTYFPAVDDGWGTLLDDHQEFVGWKYSKNGELMPSEGEVKVSFASFQMLEHKTAGKDIEARNSKADALRKEIADLGWDLVIIDEYHHGAHHASRREFVSSLKTPRILALSGTPFRALAKGDFDNSCKFDWTYLDERKALADWDAEQCKGVNPYEELPAIHFVGYRLPPLVGRDEDAGTAVESTYCPSSFFEANKNGFLHPEAVKEWLQCLRGQSGRMRRAGVDRPPYHPEFAGGVVAHALWLLPSKHSCDAMERLLAEGFLFEPGSCDVIKISGSEGVAGKPGVIAKRVRNRIAKATRSITLSVGKLTTGVTVPAWTAVFHLKAGSSLESYLQASYRCQSSGSIRLMNGAHRVKTNCFVFDYDPDRMLMVMGDYIKQLQGERPTIEMQTYSDFPTVIFDDEKSGHVSLDMIGIEERLNAALDRKRPLELMTMSMRGIEDAIAGGGLAPDLLGKLIDAGKGKATHQAVRNLEASLHKLKKPGEIISHRADRPTASPVNPDEVEDKEIKAIKAAISIFVKSLGHLAYVAELREASVAALFDVDDELFEKIMGNGKDQVREIIEGAGLDRVRLDAMIRQILTWENYELVEHGLHTIEDLRGAGRFFPDVEQQEWARKPYKHLQA